ncbi:MAG: site-specific integrase [Oscillospiraceae bacterium]|nr:site-specific integrase [Oscillospiraceae bacterium]
MKIPEPRKLKSGSYFIQLRLNGVSVPVTASTAKECKQQAALIKAEHRAGTRVVRGSETLGQAIDAYIEKRMNTLSPATIAGYKRIRDKRFQSYMDKRLAELDVQKMADSEAKLVSAKTLKNSVMLVQSVLKEYGYPTKRISLPVRIPKEKPFLEPDQVKALVASVKGTKNSLPVLFALHSLRRSEIAALDWKNVDLDNKRFSVSGAVVKDEHNKFVTKSENKIVSSARTIPIMIPELEAELKAVPEEKRKGKVIACAPDYIWVRVTKACENAGLPKMGPHALRHTFASLAYLLGMSELETMQLGGWSGSATMHKIYTHLAEVDRLKAENKMAAFYKNANENAN